LTEPAAAGAPVCDLASHSPRRFAGLRPAASAALCKATAPIRSPTAWDTAFLKALYRLPLDRIALRQRGMLASAIVAAVK